MAWRNVATALFGFIILLAFCLSLGKEIELTSEWTKLGENDTVPAGAHIRMDLSTGGRWAKLAEEGDEVPTSVEVDGSGGVMTVLESNAAKTDESTKDEKKDFDYDMMHRTLSKLPPEEQERMGGLPELPDAGPKIDPEVRKAFELRMKEIWLARQAELEAIQHEFLADMPKLLRERIQRLDLYLQDPHAELVQEWADNDEEEGVSHIVSVLQDLEYHLSDMDMARDFFTLGGWPLLVSLLSDGVHTSPNYTMTSELEEKVQDIQANAAWAIGTATKNIGEFAPYSMQELSIDGVKTNPIELLLHQMRNDDGTTQKKQKIMYALGSLLRGNPLAQVAFVQADGPAVLGQILVKASSGDNIVDTKLAKRILALADDVVSDVVLHHPEDAAIIEAFSTEDWCQSVVTLLERDALQETALETMEVLVPYCKWNKKKVKKSVEKIKRQLEAEKDNMDSNHFQEQMGFADTILSELQKKK